MKCQSQNRCLPMNKDKYLSLAYHRNKSIYNDNSKEFAFPMIKDKNILDQGESKSMSSINQLNQNSKDKSKDLYSNIKNSQSKDINTRHMKNLRAKKETRIKWVKKYPKDK